MDPVRFSTSDGVSLEGELRLPDGPPVGSAVICHAHPRHGGSKNHPILWALRNGLAQRGFAVLAFNFRGTMRSAGSFGGGRAEVKDVDAAIGSIRSRAAGPTIVCGWSFGATVALHEALTDDRVAALALIGMPLEPSGVDVLPVPGADALHGLRRPVLLLAGEEDRYCPRVALETLGRTIPSAHVAILAGTDHFLWRREKQAAEIVGEFAQSVAGRIEEEGGPPHPPP